MSRPGRRLNLLESIGRTDGLQASVLGGWVTTFAEIGRRAVGEGDVVEERDPEDIARLLVSMYIGLRQISNLAEPERFLLDLGNRGFLHCRGSRILTGSNTSLSSSGGARLLR